MTVPSLPRVLVAAGLLSGPGDGAAAGGPALAEALVRAGPGERDAAFEALAGRDERPLLVTALETRQRRAAQALLAEPTLAELERVAAERARLDAARAAALELILDETAYFYAEGAPERAAEAAEVQRRVDVRVQRVRECWQGDAEARPTEAFRAALDELVWVRERARGLRLGVERVPLPDFVQALDPAAPASASEVRSFAWNEAEAADLERARAVERRNEDLWSGARAAGGAGAATPEEAELVRGLNRYRRMLGRAPLAWNAALQRAARGHANHLAASGEFDHGQPGEARATPHRRMALEGYARPFGEALSYGRVEPEDALSGWLASSEHHRLVLHADTTEAGAARAGIYWTLNLGRDRSFEEELEGWRDSTWTRRDGGEPSASTGDE